MATMRSSTRDIFIIVCAMNDGSGSSNDGGGGDGGDGNPLSTCKTIVVWKRKLISNMYYKIFITFFLLYRTYSHSFRLDSFIFYEAQRQFALSLFHFQCTWTRRRRRRVMNNSSYFEREMKNNKTAAPLNVAQMIFTLIAKRIFAYYIIVSGGNYVLLRFLTCAFRIGVHSKPNYNYWSV